MYCFRIHILHNVIAGNWIAKRVLFLNFFNDLIQHSEKIASQCFIRVIGVKQKITQIA